MNITPYSKVPSISMLLSLHSMVMFSAHRLDWEDGLLAVCRHPVWTGMDPVLLSDAALAFS